MRLEYSAQAQASLDQIFDYIADHNMAAAERTIDRILQLADTLAKFPLIAPEGPIPGTREVIVPNINYRIVYEIERDTLRVLDVIHTRRQWPPGSG